MWSQINRGIKVIWCGQANVVHWGASVLCVWYIPCPDLKVREDHLGLQIYICEYIYICEGWWWCGGWVSTYPGGKGGAMFSSINCGEWAHIWGGAVCGIRGGHNSLLKLASNRAGPTRRVHCPACLSHKNPPRIQRVGGPGHGGHPLMPLWGQEKVFDWLFLFTQIIINKKRIIRRRKRYFFFFEAFQRTVLEMLKVSLIYWPGLCWPRGPAKALLTMVRLVSADQEALLAHLFQTPKATTALLFLFANCHLLYSFLSAHRCRQGGKVGPKFHLLAGGEGQQTPLKTSCWFHIYGRWSCPVCWHPHHHRWTGPDFIIIIWLIASQNFGVPPPGLP